MQDFLEAVSQTLGLHPAAIALPMLTVAGAAIGNSRRLQLTPGHSVPPAIWSTILSTDHSRLSRARHLVLAPLIELQEQIADSINISHSRHLLALDDWNFFRHDDFPPKPLPPKPIPPRTESRQYFFNDADYRHLPIYLARQPRGCLIVQDDLSSWFQSTPLQCLSLFDAPPFTFDHIKSLRIRFAPHAFLAITGSLAPGQFLPSSPNSNSIRLASHFLITCPPQTRSARPFTSINPRISSAWSDLLSRLYSLDPSPSLGSIKPILIPLHRKAASEHNAAHEHLATSFLQESDPRLRDHLLNLIDYIPRIALILQLAADADESPRDFVDAFSITSAAKIIEWLAGDLKRIYTNLTLNSTATETLSLLTLIARRGGKITARQLMRSSRHFSRSTSAAQTLLQNLATKGFGLFSSDSRENRQSPTFHLSCRADAALHNNDPLHKN